MSQYIQPENQTILWNVVQKIKLFHSLIPLQQQETWFKQIIGYFYQQNKHRKIGTTELQILNKQTIETIIQSLQSMQSQTQIQSRPQTQMQEQPPTQYQHVSNENILHNREPIVRLESQMNSYSNEFVYRQKEYENMNKKETPLEPKFQETIEDKAIENMDELIQQHIKQREQELIPFHSSNTSTSITPIIYSNTTEKNNSIQILENTIEHIELQDIISPEIKKDGKKSVTWETTIPIVENNDKNNEMENINKILFIQKENIEQMKETIEILKKRMNEMNEEFEIFRKSIQIENRIRLE